MWRARWRYCVALLCVAASALSPCCALTADQGDDVASSHKAHAAHARWLIHQADYAIVTAQSTLKEGFPFSNVMSLSDGPESNSTGRLLFYLATISQFVTDIAQDDRVSLTVSQEQAFDGSGCKHADPEWPMCSRVTVLGNAKEVPKSEESEVSELMFARHPQMRSWAYMAHKWQFYELHIDHAYVLDWFGGYHAVARDEYFAAEPVEPWQ